MNSGYGVDDHVVNKVNKDFGILRVTLIWSISPSVTGQPPESLQETLPSLTVASGSNDVILLQ